MKKTLSPEQIISTSREIEKLTEEYQVSDTLIKALRKTKYIPMFKMLSMAIKELTLEAEQIRRRGRDCPITEEDVIDLLIEHNEAAYKGVNRLTKMLEESQEES